MSDTWMNIIIATTRTSNNNNINMESNEVKIRLLFLLLLLLLLFFYFGVRRLCWAVCQKMRFVFFIIFVKTPLNLDILSFWVHIYSGIEHNKRNPDTNMVISMNDDDGDDSKLWDDTAIHNDI